jgi:hypothetical protein
MGTHQHLHVAYTSASLPIRFYDQKRALLLEKLMGGENG